MSCSRLLAAAFLENEGHLLLMRRSPSASLMPGMLAPVGGHIEASEINDPTAACIREITEETGLSPHEIEKLSLRYIVHRLRHNEVRTQYVYFASTTKVRLYPNHEGVLQWMPIDALHNLAEASFTTRAILNHYLKSGSKTENIYVGVVEGLNSPPIIHWAILSDWE